VVKAGKIVNVSLGSANTATALVPRAGEANTTLVLGQFVMLGKASDARMILARVVSIQPDFGEAGRDYKDAVRQAMSENQEVDAFYQASLLYLQYECKLLGVCEIGEGTVEFFSDVRHFPPLNELEVFIPSPKVMTSLMRSAVRAKSETDVIEFHIGDLAYGSDPSNTSIYSGKNSVPVLFNAKNILRRRTMVVGKSGYGKSNSVKGIIGMIASATKNVGQLLIDTNSEYSLDNSQNEGFLDIFHQAGMPDKVVMFTNRTLPEATKEKFKRNIRALRIDAYSEPATVFAMVAESVRRQIKNDVLPKYLQKWVNGAEVEDNKSAWEGSGEIRSLYYAALSNENIRPAKEGQRCEVGTKIHPDYLHILLNGSAPPPDDEDDAGKYSLTDEEKLRLKDEFFIIPDKRQFYTNHIGTMAGFGKWFAEKEKADKEVEFRDFCELVTKHSYRLSSIKKLHVAKASEGTGQSLSASVFGALSEGKIVILDLATESIRVSDVLTRHILNHIFTRMVDDFGRPEIRTQFAKRDIVVYIEEAQNFLSDRNISDGSIYERIVKEGRKFHIGTVYVTQQPSAISPSITSQTENIFALHLSNEKDTAVLNSIKDKFDQLTCRFIKDEAAQGLCYVYSEPYQPFVLSCQMKLFSKELITTGKS
jgi:hypothetical protein